MNWFDENSILHVDPQPSTSENGILFTAEYLFLLSKLYSPAFLRKEYVKKIIDHHARPDGTWRNSKDPNDVHWSHDNHTALVSLSYKFGLDAHKYFPRDWLKRPHPRDLVYYGLLKGSPLALPFVFVLCAAQVISCLQAYKVRNGVKILKTDGKLLTWLRCETLKETSFSMRLCWRICDKIINWKFKRGWPEVFEIYFKHPGHPNRVLSRMYWGGL